MKVHSGGITKVRAKKIIFTIISVLTVAGIMIGASDAFDAKAKTTYADIEKFPESYKENLYALKEKHPNWTFEVMNTGLDWSTVLYNEMNPAQRSLVPSYFQSGFVGDYYGDGWSCATQAAVEYYMDPRNWLTEEYIFQFEKLTYNGTTQGIATVQKVLQNTFMSGFIQSDAKNDYTGMGLTYAKAFYDIGNYIGVSPVHLATRVKQEQGTQGTSDLISGTYPGYEGYYNYYNIQASGSTHEQIVVNGLNEAKSEGWDTRYGALLGGSQKIASRYILRCQDTLYLQKFDVDGAYDGRYWHQYMQNLAAPSNEGRNIKKAYESAGMLDEAFVFKIPVYNNMPGSIENGRKFVQGLYVNILGRECSSDESKEWATALTNRVTSCSEAAMYFISCDEYKQRDENIRNSDYIRMLYAALLNREPSEDEIDIWMGAFKNRYSRKYIFKQFTDSSEFVQLCSAYGLEAGQITISDDEIYEDPRITQEEKKEFSQSLISKLYSLALGREGTAEEIEMWSSSLTGGGATIEGTFYCFIFSDEFKARNVNDTEFIRTLYTTMLNREVSEQEIAIWMGCIDQNYSRKYIFKQFTEADEFKQIYTMYKFATENIVLSDDEIYNKPKISQEEKKAFSQSLISNLYSQALGRTGSTEEIEAWSDSLVGGSATIEGTFYCFIFSDEFLERNVSDAEFIRILYATMFNREAGEQEIAIWMGCIDQNYSRKYVFKQFAEVDEFKQIYAKYEFSTESIVLGDDEIFN